MAMVVCFYELKKILIKHKGIIVLPLITLLILVFLIAGDTPSNLQMEIEKEQYLKIEKELHLFGPCDDVKTAKIDQYEEDYYDALKEYDEKTIKLKRGEIELFQFQKNVARLSEILHAKAAIDQFHNQIDYASGGPEKRYIMYTNGWSSFFNMQYDFLLILLAIVIAGSVFAPEIDSGMKNFLIICKKGCISTVIQKIFILTVMNVTTGCIIHLLFIIFLHREYGLWDGNYPIQSIPEFSQCTSDIAIGDAALLLSFARILSMLIASFAASSVMLAVANNTAAFSLSIVFIFLPSVLTVKSKFEMYLPTGLKNTKVLMTGIEKSNEEFVQFTTLESVCTILMAGCYLVLFLSLTIRYWKDGNR